MKRSPFDTLQLQYNHYKIKFTVEIYFTPSLSVTAVFKLKNELVAIGYNSFFWKRTTLSCLRKRFRNGRYIHLLNYTQNKGRTKLTGSLVNVANFKARFSPIFFNVVYKGNIYIIPKATIGFWLTRNEEVIINSNIFLLSNSSKKESFQPTISTVTLHAEDEESNSEHCFSRKCEDQPSKYKGKYTHYSATRLA